jgi:enoyl-[acyl-carrier-protein] reductase (NADH)
VSEGALVAIGGGRGFGWASLDRIAQVLKQRNVYLGWTNNEVEARKRATELEERGHTVNLIRLNVMDDAVAVLRAALAQNGDSIEHLIFSTSLGKWSLLEEVNERNLRRTIEVMATSFPRVVLGLRDLFTNSSCVTCFSSHGGDQASVFYGAMGIAKAVMEEAVRLLDEEMGPTVRVNAVKAWIVDTESFRASPGWQATKTMTELRSPMGRMLLLNDIADAVEAVHVGALSVLRGAVLTVDGGLFHTIV